MCVCTRFDYFLPKSESFSTFTFKTIEWKVWQSVQKSNFFFAFLHVCMSLNVLRSPNARALILVPKHFYIWGIDAIKFFSELVGEKVTTDDNKTIVGFCFDLMVITVGVFGVP